MANEWWPLSRSQVWPSRVLVTIVLPLALVRGVSAFCLSNPGVPEEFKSSYAVFVGTVVANEHTPASSNKDQDGDTYSVRVDEVLKGKLAPTVRIFSENSSGRFPMQVKTKYLLFVSGDYKARLMVDSCGNSEVFSDLSPKIEAARRLKSGQQTK
jgi:hypothetical protein